MMLVGEQHGDEKDIRGSPLVGPAGCVLIADLLRAARDARGLGDEALRETCQRLFSPSFHGDAVL
jgi:uracil-DNA glycosylase